MKIRSFNTLANGVYQVAIYTEDWSESDKQLMIKYGEPSVDIGGSFLGDVPYLDFTLSSKLVLIMSETPFTQRFDSRDFADAEDRANHWKSTIVDRLSGAIAILRTGDDTFTKEEVETV